jgi:hypothetical protein
VSVEGGQGKLLMRESDVDAMSLLNSELFDAVPQSPKRHA